MVTSAQNIEPALNGEDVGTWFSTTGGRRNARLLWLAHLADIKGSLVLDDGAVRAVGERNSLLAAGVTAVKGEFDAGDPVSLLDAEGREVAHGICNYAADEIPEMLGKSTDELGEELGPRFERELVHVDNLVTMRAKSAKTKVRRGKAADRTFETRQLPRVPQPTNDPQPTG